MKRRSLLAASAALAAAPLSVPAQAQGGRAKIVFWHAMTGSPAETLNLLANGFNISQNTTEVSVVYKGPYPETLTAVTAASRAGQAPNLVQIFEIGTASMLAAGKAVKQNWELIKDSGVAIDPAAYIPAVRGYYSLADGRLASLPFNASTAMMFYNKDSFEKAGLDPEKPPATWDEWLADWHKLKGRERHGEL